MLNRPTRSAAVLLLLLCWMQGSEARAEAVYVTDELRLGLYRGELTEGRPFKTLISGDRLEVLERALMSVRVRTEDGEEGWVKTAYLVSAEPARRRANLLEAENAELSAQLAEQQNAVESAGATLRGLEEQLAATSQGIAELPALQQENSQLNRQLAASGSRIPAWWAALGALAAFSLGGVIGYLWLDRKVRSQFGGVRVY